MTPEVSKQQDHESSGTIASTVSVHALSGGHFTLPEYQFVHPVSQDACRTVPSLAFLTQHCDQSTGKQTRIVFDLGLRRDVKRYAPPIQKHIETRQPMTTQPDVTKSLSSGGLHPNDIDYVVYSHVRAVFTHSLEVECLMVSRYTGTILVSLETSRNQPLLLGMEH